MSIKLATVWSKGLDPQDIAEVKEGFVGTLAFRKRFIEILQEKINSNRTKILNPENFNTPNWDKYAADSIGYERALTEVINILTGRVDN